MLVLLLVFQNCVCSVQERESKEREGGKGEREGKRETGGGREEERMRGR